MNTPYITRLSISNFRGLTDVELDGLGMVNLIVGENNVGKTTLLEALDLLSADSRHMFRQGGYSTRVTQGRDKGHIKATRRELEKILDVDFTRLGISSRVPGQARLVAIPSTIKVIADLNQSVGRLLSSPENEDRAAALLRAIDPRIRDLRQVIQGGTPSILINVGLPSRLPVQEMGQGIYRTLTILAELLGSGAQVCLIDEIESGLHYRAMTQVWKGIAEISRQLGIQVFATTHSRECIEAAREVFISDDKTKSVELAVIQLMRVRDKVEGRVLREADIDAAVDAEIEVR